MKNAIILHGTGGGPESNWFIWLKAELEKKDLQVWLPQLPRTEQPSLRDNVDFIHANCPFAVGPETLVIGHSSGAILALILAQENKAPVGGVVAVSVFHDNSLAWEALDRLFDIAFDWKKIQQNSEKLLFLHSDNDPYVPLEQAEFVAENCGQEIVVIPGQGHFNLEHSDSYKQFPELLELLKQKKILE